MGLQVYATEDMKLLGKKSFKYPGVKEFVWSPQQDCFAAYIPQQDQQPARVVIVEVK
jgi:translation initiation factor 3 subunit B